MVNPYAQALQDAHRRKLLLRDVKEWGVQHKRSCNWLGRPNFKKNEPCSCGRDVLMARIEAELFPQLEPREILSKPDEPTDGVGPAEPQEEK